MFKLTSELRERISSLILLLFFIHLFFLMMCRLQLIHLRIQSTLMETAFLRSCLQSCILHWTSPKGRVPFYFDIYSTILVPHFFFTQLISLEFHRYICSSGEKESKPVTSLFDGYWKNWVCSSYSIGLVIVLQASFISIHFSNYN